MWPIVPSMRASRQPHHVRVPHRGERRHRVAIVLKRGIDLLEDRLAGQLRELRRRELPVLAPSLVHAIRQGRHPRRAALGDEHPQARGAARAHPTPPGAPPRADRARTSPRSSTRPRPGLGWPSDSHRYRRGTRRRRRPLPPPPRADPRCRRCSRGPRVPCTAPSPPGSRATRRAGVLYGVVSGERREHGDTDESRRHRHHVAQHPVVVDARAGLVERTGSVANVTQSPRDGNIS